MGLSPLVEVFLLVCVPYAAKRDLLEDVTPDSVSDVSSVARSGRQLLPLELGNEDWLEKLKSARQ